MAMSGMSKQEVLVSLLVPSLPRYLHCMDPPGGATAVTAVIGGE